MTMLTPLGAGGAAQRTRRRWPRVLAVLVVLGMVAGLAAGAWWWFAGRESADPAPAPTASRTCTTPTPKAPGRLPPPSEITVAVANGTPRAGLAVQTADDLVNRGFTVTSIGNTDKPVNEGVALVRFGRGDLASAIVVASFFPGAELVEVSGGEVAVWLGPDFDGVAAADEADPDAVALPAGEPVCRRQR
jgi:hypothetical protein